jgi:pimeloyl-ACP methyl ester carboxylesterase
MERIARWAIIGSGILTGGANAHADFELAPFLSATNAGQELVQYVEEYNETPVLKGSEISTPSTEWNISFLIEWFGAQPTESVYVFLIPGMFGDQVVRTEAGEGSAYSRTALSITDGFVGTKTVSLEYPLFGAPNVPSGTNTLMVVRFPEEKFVTGSEPGEFTKEPYTLGDFLTWFSVGHANVDDDTGELLPGASETYQPDVTRSFEFAYEGISGANTAPMLAFPDEYAGVEPMKGVPNKTEFVFRVVYTDADNDPPSSVVALINEDDLVPLQPDPNAAAQLRDGNYVNGEQYAAKHIFSERGVYANRFVASDGTINAELPLPTDVTVGYSSVIFLPGFQASRLYQQGAIFENQLWEPNKNSDALKLLMDAQGESVGSGIYTRDIIGESNIITPDGFGGLNIYKEFSEMMDGLVENETIADWEAFPYDWRYDLPDILNNPVQLENITYDMAARLEALASSSDTGAITIIGHSNGGLLGKLLISKLEAQDKAYLVDQFIMAGTPQIGTPQAIAAMLHGYKQDIPKNFGGLLSKSTARLLAENMPGAYNLLPFAGYFDAVDDPVIVFSTTTTLTQNWRSLYGTEIDTASELESFLLGQDGRAKPPATSVLLPNILNPTLYANAKALRTQLDDWQAPEGIEVSQIVGWGLDTIRGIRYTQYTDCSSGVACVPALSQEPIFTVEGDKTVVYRSSNDYQSEETFYFNLGNYNRIGELKRNREHADLLEAEPIRILIRNLITLRSGFVSSYISTLKPTTETIEETLRVVLRSPVSLLAIDTSGNKTGILGTTSLESDVLRVTQEIPNSYYLEFGEGKYIGLDTKDEYTLELVGTGKGTFTLEIIQVERGKETKKVEFKDVPVLPNSKADLSMNSFDEISTIEIDYDGNGTKDFTAESEGKVSATTTLKQFESVVKVTTMPGLTKLALLGQTKLAFEFLRKGKIKEAKATLFAIRGTIQISTNRVIKWEDALVLNQLLNKVITSLR